MVDSRRVLKVVIAGDTKGLRTAINGALGETKRASTGFQKFAKVGSAAFLGIAAGAAIFGGASVKAALEGEKSHARLATAIKNTGKDFERYEDRVDKASEQLAEFGFENDEVEDSLARLTAATKSPERALQRMQLVADIARGRNISLAASTDLLTKVETGRVGLLGRLGIQTKDATGKTISQEEAIRKLSQMYGGAAATSAETFTGKTEALRAKMANLQEKIGTKLIPVLLKLIDITEDVVKWFSKHRVVAIALAVVVGGALTAAMIAYTASAISAAIATIAATWPIIAITVAVVALTAAIIYTWTHWNQIWNQMKSHPAYAAIVVALLPMVGSVLAIVAAAKILSQEWRNVWAGMSATTNTAGSVIRRVTDAIVSAFRVLERALQQVKRVYDDTIGRIGGAGGSLLGKAGDLLGKAGGIIPRFAMGGTVGGPVGAPQLAVVHGGETVIPVGGNAGGMHVHLHVTPGFGANAKQFMRDLADEVTRDARSGGPVTRALKVATA